MGDSSPVIALGSATHLVIGLRRTCSGDPEPTPALESARCWDCGEVNASSPPKRVSTSAHAQGLTALEQKRTDASEELRDLRDLEAKAYRTKVRHSWVAWG